MIAIMIMGVIAVYIAILFLALWLIPKVVHYKHIKRIIFIVWFLIPTWDVIIGYPIYKFLCATQAGVKIYKTVDNVEGFYVGEQRKEFEPYEPYEGYKYIDYKEMDFFKPTGKKYGTYWTGKYYRSYWIDSNTSEICVPVGDDAWTNDGELYSKYFRSGKCIVKEEIAEGEVSRWEVYNSYWTNRKTLIPILSFKKDELVYIKDRTDHKKIGQIIDYWWKNGWFIGYFLTGWSVNFEPQGVHCIYDPYKSQEIEKQFLFQTLKPKVQEKK